MSSTGRFGSFLFELKKRGVRGRSVRAEYLVAGLQEPGGDRHRHLSGAGKTE